MEAHNIFKNISPLDHRYLLANKELFKNLQKTLSEEASISYCIEVEAALLKAHIHTSLGKDADLEKEADELVHRIAPQEVYDEEEKTQHNIRALVNVIKSKVTPKLQPYVHLGATSVDILDTAFSLRMRDAVRDTILPLMIEVEELLIGITLEHAETPQVGRTHGQHAVPVTVGFAFAEYVARFGKAIQELASRSTQLKGKLAGAVGAYNATSMMIADPVEFERLSLSFVGIEPSEISTQMVEPEYLLRVLLEMNTAFGVLANLADDLRHLQRSEISEVREFFSSSQVGSSTMPQKRNPWNSEHVKSLWKAYAPRVLTFYMDQISEHQRDLSNSASSRFTVEYIAGFGSALNRMRKILSSLYVDRERLKKNLESAGDLVLAEPAYILLSLGGEADAHEVIRKITVKCEREKCSFVEGLKSDVSAWNRIRERLLSTTGQDAEAFFSEPWRYRGEAVSKANEVAEKYREVMRQIGKELHTK